MKNFPSSDSNCELLFESLNPLWHVYTPGKESRVFLVNAEDFAFAINALFLASQAFPDVQILATEFMNNHLHLTLSGLPDRVALFFDFFKRKLARGLPDGLPAEFNETVKPIETLKSARNTIVYQHRNRYVVNPAVTPFSDPWSTGMYYFNRFDKGRPLSEFSYLDKRKMFRGRIPEISDNCRVINGHIAQNNFCKIDLGESLFRDARQYFFLLNKNVESYAELALDLNDEVFLTDEETYAAAVIKARDLSGQSNFKLLDQVQKVALCQYLHYSLRAGNAQIRRILGCSQQEIDSLFPMNNK